LRTLPVVVMRRPVLAFSTRSQPAPPGKVCHLETKTVLVQEGYGSQAQYVLKPQWPTQGV
jgi:hypothetical protein